MTYERFTDRARKVMSIAENEARNLRHEYISTEHMLLGLVREGSGVASTALQHFGLSTQMIRNEIEKVVSKGPEVVPSVKLPHTPRAKMAIEYAHEECRNLNHNYIGTEHLLLGLLREREGVASQILMNLGLKLEEVRDHVASLLGETSVPEVMKEFTKNPFAISIAMVTPILEALGQGLTVRVQDGQIYTVTGEPQEK